MSNLVNMYWLTPVGEPQKASSCELSRLRLPCRGSFSAPLLPVERQQVIRVEFSSAENSPPLFTKVTLRSPNVLPSWMKSAASNAFRSGFSFAREASAALFNLGRLRERCHAVDYRCLTRGQSSRAIHRSVRARMDKA